MHGATDSVSKLAAVVRSVMYVPFLKRHLLTTLFCGMRIDRCRCAPEINLIQFCLLRRVVVGHFLFPPFQCDGMDGRCSMRPNPLLTTTLVSFFPDSKRHETKEGSENLTGCINAVLWKIRSHEKCAFTQIKRTNNIFARNR
jgi:hypothetical protein